MTKPISETYFRDQLVIPLAKLLGYLVYFTWKSYHSPAGFPDLCLVRPRDGRLIFSELKTDTGKVSPAQQIWLDALSNTDAEVYCWRPADLPNIQKILERKP